MFTPALLTFAALAFLAAPVSAAAADPTTPTGFPFTDEDLNYSINWPTGASLGEAHLHAKHSGADWSLALNLAASIPGFSVKDNYHSDIVPDYCSISFDRSTLHGSRTVKEKETIDRERALATRQNLLKDGGMSDIPVPACVKDALAYLYYSRRELGQGRVPAAQQILFGGLYQILVEYTGAPIITVSEKQVQSDKVTCTITAGASRYQFDMYFARDPARTPLLISAPLSMGKFSMELVR
jgi:hypothetical protein